MRSLVVFVLVALLSTSAASAWAGGVEVGSRAPELDEAAENAKGKRVSLKAMRGDWVVVTIGASWCKPCKKELPAWDKLAKRYKGKVTFVAINIDNKREKGVSFMKKLKIKNMKIVYSPEKHTTTADSYVGTGDDAKFPTTFVIDPKGVVRHVHKTYHDGDAKKLGKTLDKLLADE